MRTAGMKKIVMAAMATVALALGSGQAHAEGEALQIWNVIAVNASVAVAKRTQAVSTIEVAMVQAAVYDAVNAIDGNRYEAYASAPAVPEAASVDAAIATAAHDVLVWLFPAQQAALDVLLTETLNALPAGPDIDAGAAAGASAAQAVIARRTGDGRDAAVSWTPPQGPGGWVPTPPAFAAPQTPWVALMKPFTMTGPSQFSPGPPPALTSADYTEAVTETATRGAKTGSTRSATETEQALFWSDNFTVQYNRYLRDLAAARGLSTAAVARLLAQVNMAAGDAFIGCMDAKYRYGFWRPVTAIPGWLPLLTTPNHPEYPSAHSCGSGAIVDTLAAFFGTDHIESTISSTVAGAGAPRTFARFKDILRDVSESRILGGLHFRFSLNAGRDIGSKVARQLAKEHFRLNE